jgi:hypothetical protein
MSVSFPLVFKSDERFQYVDPSASLPLLFVSSVFFLSFRSIVVCLACGVERVNGVRVAFYNESQNPTGRCTACQLIERPEIVGVIRAVHACRLIERGGAQTKRLAQSQRQQLPRGVVNLAIQTLRHIHTHTHTHIHTPDCTRTTHTHRNTSQHTMYARTHVE